MNTTFDDEPVWITNDDALSETSDASEFKEELESPESPTPENAKCGDILRITHPDTRSIDTEGSCLFWSKPRMSFQLRQGPSWNQSSTCSVFNIWCPPSYFGATLTQLGPNPVKLNSNDLIVTSSAKDSETRKSSGTGSLPLVEENLVAAIDIDHPGYFCCSVCFSYRGRVLLANGERWRFNHIDSDYDHFTREYDPEISYSKANGKSLVWMYYYSSRLELMNGVPDDLPFAMDIDARICRVKRPSNYADQFGGPVLAVMNRDGIVCCEGLEKNAEIAEIDTDKIQELVMMTGLAVARYERWLQE